MVQQLAHELGQGRKTAAISDSNCVYRFLIMKNREEYYMSLAIEEAKKAELADEVPIGCVIVCDDMVIARNHNHKESKNNAIYHAEVEAILEASKVKNNWNLNDCDLYVTLEPCMMCTGIINLSRIRTVYYGTQDPKGGCLETVIDLKKINRLNHYPNIVGNILQKECSEILTNYFRKKREIIKEKKQKNKANIQ